VARSSSGSRPKDLSMVLDAALQYDPEILQFAVEGWPPDVDFADFTEESLWEALVDDTAGRLEDV
jgi:hypothetical protein